MNEKNLTPVVPLGALSYLEKAFKLSEVVTHSNKKIKNNDELVGYMRGVTDVLNLVRRLANPKEDDISDVLEY